MNRKRIVIICPGRGSYTRETQGYLNEYKEPHIDKINYMDKQILIKVTNNQEYWPTFHAFLFFQQSYQLNHVHA